MIDISSKKYIIFDLDGTIVRLGVDWPACRAEVKSLLIEKYPQLLTIFEEKEEELSKLGRKLTVETMGTVVFESLGRDVYEDFGFIQEKYETSFSLDQAEVREEIVNFIKKQCKEHVFSICSNNSLAGVQYTLDLLDIRNCFETIESRRPGRPPKPDRTIMTDLLGSLGADIEECLYIGDNSVTDEGLAVSFKMDYLDYRDFISMI